MALKDTWVPKVNDVDEVNADDINMIAHSVINLESNGVAGKSPYIGENGNWFEYNTELKQYEDTGVKAQGKDGKEGASGLPVIETRTDTYTEPTLPAYTEIRYVNPVEYIGISDFEYNTKNVGNDMWAVIFTAGEGITVSIPGNVVWSVAEPVFTAGYTYYLSFIPFGDKVLGVWVAKELTAE